MTVKPILVLIKMVVCNDIWWLSVNQQNLNCCASWDLQKVHSAFENPLRNNWNFSINILHIKNCVQLRIDDQIYRHLVEQLDIYIYMYIFIPIEIATLHFVCFYSLCSTNSCFISALIQDPVGFVCLSASYFICIHIYKWIWMYSNAHIWNL